MSDTEIVSRTTNIVPEQPAMALFTYEPEDPINYVPTPLPSKNKHESFLNPWKKSDGRVYKEIKSYPVLFSIFEENLEEFKPLEKDDVSAVRLCIRELSPHASESVISFGINAQMDSTSFTDGMMELTKQSDGLANDKLKEIMGLVSELNVNKIFQKHDGLLSKFTKHLTPREAFDQNIGRINSLCESIQHNLPELEDFINKIKGFIVENQNSDKELRYYHIAGKLMKKYIEEQIIPKLDAASDIATTSVEKTGELLTMKNVVSNLETRLNDIYMSKVAVLQTLTQLFSMRDVFEKSIHQIQDLITITIPLWKKNYVTALVLYENGKLDELNSSIHAVEEQQGKIMSILQATVR